MRVLAGASVPVSQAPQTCTLHCERARSETRYRILILAAPRMRQRSWLASQRMLARRSADGGEAALFRTLVDGRSTDEAKKLARRAAAVAEMLARRAAAVAKMPRSGCIPLREDAASAVEMQRRTASGGRGGGCVGSRSLRRVTLLLRRGKPPLPRAWRGILSLLQHATAASDSFPSLPSPLGCPMRRRPL